MNGRNIINLFTVLFVLLIVYSAPASALSEDFYIYSQKEVLSSCAHSMTTESLVIRNTGDVASTYSLSKSGEAASFVSYSEPIFSLAPGTEKTIYIYIVPGNVKGNYNLKTTIQTTFGLVKSVKQDVEVENCANLNVFVKNPIVKVNPCTPAQFSIVVKNTGSFVDTYHFSIDKFAEYSAISEIFVVLGPDQSREVQLFVNPACEIYGEQEMVFSILAETSGFLGEVNLKLDIERNYPYKVDVPENINICKFENKVIEVYVENQADISNVFDLSVNGPRWAELEHDNLFLGAKQSSKTHLNMTPTKAGEFTIEIKALSRRGDIEKAGERIIVVEDCYVNELYIEQRKDILVSGESKSYPILIKNIGTKEDGYTLELNAPDWARLVPGDFLIQPGKEKSTALEVDIPQNVTGDFRLTVNADSSYASDKDELIIDVISQERAYKIEIDPKDTRVDLGKNEIVVDIKHKGLRGDKYDLRLEAPSWIKLKDDALTLAPGETKEVILEINQNKEGYAQVKLSVTPENKGVAFVSNFKVKVGPAWYEKVGSFLWAYKWYFILGLITLAILIPGIIFTPRIIKHLAEKRAVYEEIRKAKELTSIEQDVDFVEKKFDLKKLLKVIGIVVAIGLVVTGIFMIPTVFKFGEEQGSIISIDKSGFSGSDNTIIVNDLEDFFVPLVIQNNYDDELTFEINERVSWIKATKDEVTVKAGESEIVNLMISPTENIEENEYKVDVSVEVDKDGEVLKEAIDVKIIKATLWERIAKFFVIYWLYFVIGLVILAPVLIVIHRKTRKEGVAFVESKVKGKVKLSKK